MGEFVSKKRILARKAHLENVRNPHIKDWKKITDVIRPSRGNYLSTSTEESKRPTSLVNSTPAIASRTLQAGMISGASSPAYQWFKFELDDPAKNNYLPYKVALEQRERITMMWLASSNLYQSLQTLYGDAADFGNGIGLLDKHPRDMFTAKIMSPGEYVIDVDDSGDIDTYISEVTKSCVQLMSNADWVPRLSPQVRDAYDKGNYNTTFQIVQCIEPNQELDESRADWRGKPWVKFTFELANNKEGEEEFLEISGYDDWPGFNLRWDLASGNIWGQGPGLLALGDSIALQTTEFRDAQAIEKAVKPTLQAPSNMRNLPISQAPGGIVYYDPYSANNAKVEPLYQIMPGILNALDSKIQRMEQRINEAYYKDLFLMLASSDRREITAREVEEKHEEKLLGLGPVLQRTHRDTLSNIIIRAYKILDEAGAFPPAPKELVNSAISIRYTSALAYAQKAAGATSLERFFGFVGNVAAAYPKITYKIDPLKSADVYADAIGVPSEILVENEQAEASYSKDAQQAQGAQQASATRDLAQGAQLLSQTDTTRPSALQFLLNQGGLG